MTNTGRNRWFIFMLAATLMMACGSPGQEKGGEGRATYLPDTPAGRAFGKFLGAVTSDDNEAYIKENFSPDFLDEFRLENRLDFFRQVREMHGGFEMTEHSIEEASEYSIVAVVKSRKRDAWRRLEIFIQHKPPYKIEGLGIDVAGDPSLSLKPPKAMNEEEMLEFIRKSVRKMEEEDRFSGALLVAKNGTPLLTIAVGLASKEFSVPNDPMTKFNVGSINKSFTQMAIAQLLERGRISLDDKLGKYRPDFPPEMADNITIRHLLTMQSGMTSYWNEEWESRFAKIRTVEDLVGIIKRIPLAFAPGTGREYSNSGYVVLGAIIETVSGMSYYDYVRKKIFIPAGMKNTDSYEVDAVVQNLARGYTRESPDHGGDGNARGGGGREQGGYRSNFFLHSVKGSPAGGGYSTLDDLNAYVEALKTNELAQEKYTNLVLGLFENGEDSANRPGGFGIAGGAPVGINAAVEADFNSGYTVIVLSNYDPPVAENLALDVVRLLRENE